MATCATCKTLILFGGVSDGGRRYCNATCHAGDAAGRVAPLVPDEAVEAEAARLHAGPCPHCGGPGPVDLHQSHTCVSFLVMTRWKSTPVLACRACGRKRQLGAAGMTLFTGWWGFPWGLIFTPTQIVRNLVGVAGGPRPNEPSVEMKRLVLAILAEQLARQGTVPPPLGGRGFDVLPPPPPQQP